MGYVIYDLWTIVKHLAFPLRQEAIKGFCVLYLSKNRNRKKKKKTQKNVCIPVGATLRITVEDRGQNQEE